MNTQADIFMLILLILLMANEKGGCGCGNSDDPFASSNGGCSCFGSINSCILCCLLLSVCRSCGGNNNDT